MQFLEHSGTRCTVRAPAKVNLSLRVLAREESGYHQIETLFCAVDLADDVEVVLQPRGTEDDVALHLAWDSALQPVQPQLGDPAANLAFRAARAFNRRADVRDAVAISLRKRIPAGAGLGGGSADAAAVLVAMNRLHGDRLADHELMDLGASLGSDVPFLLSGAPVALAWGRGTRILPLPPPPPAWGVLLMPRAVVATADAYAALAAARGNAAPAPAGVLRYAAAWDAIGREAINDFEAVIFPHASPIADAWRALQRHEPVLVRMTGSGSCVFGVFGDRATADTAAADTASRLGVAALVVRMPAGAG